MSASTWQAGVSPDRRVTPDRRACHSILSQEALARIIVETRGVDSHAGRALEELAQRRQTATHGDVEDDELIVYSLRGQWNVATVGQARQAMIAAAAAACRRRRPSAEATLPAAPPEYPADGRSHH